MNVYSLDEIKDDILGKNGESIQREIYEKTLNIGSVVFAKEKPIRSPKGIGQKSRNTIKRTL